MLRYFLVFIICFGVYGMTMGQKKYEKESDLKPDEIADALTDAFDEYYEVEDEISFQPEGEDEELDMGETEGGG